MYGSKSINLFWEHNVLLTAVQKLQKYVLRNKLIKLNVFTNNYTQS